MNYITCATKFTGAAALLLAVMGQAEAAACRVLFNGLTSYPAAQSLVQNGVNVVSTNGPLAISNYLSAPGANLPQYDAIWLHWYNATYSSPGTPTAADAAALEGYLAGGGRVHFTQDYGTTPYNDWAMGIINNSLLPTAGGGNILTGPNGLYGGAWNLNPASINNVNSIPYVWGASVTFDNGGVLVGPVPARNRIAYQGALGDPTAPISVAAFGEADMNGNAGRITYFGDGGNLGPASQTDPNMRVIKNLQAFLLAPSSCSAPLAAENDLGAVDEAGGIAISNVLANDDMNPGGLHGQVIPGLGSVVTMAEVQGTNTSPTGFPMVLDTNTGTISLAAATPPGTYALQYQYCQISNPDNCATATATVEVTGPTELTAVNDVAHTTQGQAVSIDVRANDFTSPAGAAVAAPGISSLPLNGSVSVDGLGHMVYTPQAAFFGVDTFSYALCLQAMPAVCKTALVTVNVLGSTAAPDSATTPINTPVTISILGNDASSDAAMAPLAAAATAQSAPAHGAVVYNANGSATYTPAAGYTGADSFSYQICTLQGPYPQTVCATAQVSVVVVKAASADIPPAPMPPADIPPTDIRSLTPVPANGPWGLLLASLAVWGMAARRYRLH